MDISTDKLNEHALVKNARRKFDSLFIELQKMKHENESPEFSNFIFLLETQLIDIYYKRIIQNLEIISSAEPNIISFKNYKELSEFALNRLTTVLNSYDKKHISTLLKCITLSPNKNI